MVETSDAAPDALTRYGEVVSTVVRLAGVELDLAGAVRRSQGSIRADLAENAQQVGKRLVLTLDHVDRFGWCWPTTDDPRAAAAGAAIDALIT